ncbi:MAG: glycoside hydrolase family 3 N-terminal domain-containing protein [Pseudomonadota bacterium]
MVQPLACILSVSGPVLTQDEAKFLGETDPWGVIMMGRSCDTPPQVRALVESIWSATGRETLIFIDQEGGRVARLRPPEWPAFPAAAAYGELYARDRERGAEACWLGHRLLSHMLYDLGIRADCAPVLDVRQPSASDVVGDRSFSSNADHVEKLSSAARWGLQDGAVAPVIKHVPGHGRAMVDSHKSLPVVSATLDELAVDFAPFQALRDAPMALTAHIAYDSLDPGTPATHSSRVINEVVRRRIGFEGLLMSDDLGMDALGDSLGERASKALAAGCDVALHCSGFVKDPGQILSEMREIANSCGPLSDVSAERAARVEAVTHRPEAFDAEWGWARFRELLPQLGAAA